MYLYCGYIICLRPRRTKIHSIDKMVWLIVHIIKRVHCPVINQNLFIQRMQFQLVQCHYYTNYWCILVIHLYNVSCQPDKWPYMINNLDFWSILCLKLNDDTSGEYWIWYCVNWHWLFHICCGSEQECV